MILSFLTLFGFLFCSVLLLTKFRFVANNSILKLLQQRYMAVGWDVFVTMEALGIDPLNPKLVDANKEIATTNCSLGSVLQQLYMSGPSGLVHLADGYIFHDGGFSKEPVSFAYPSERTQAIGLVMTRSSARGPPSARPLPYTLRRVPTPPRLPPLRWCARASWTRASNSRHAQASTSSSCTSTPSRAWGRFCS